MDKRITHVYHECNYKFCCHNCGREEIYTENVYDEKSHTSLETIKDTVSKINSLGYSAKVGFLCSKCQSQFNNKKVFFEIEYNGKIKSCFTDADTADYFVTWDFLSRRSKKYSNDIDCLNAILEDWAEVDRDNIKRTLRRMLGLEGIKCDNIFKRLKNLISKKS